MLGVWLAVVAAVLGLRSSGLLQPAELAVYDDLLSRIERPAAVSDRIALIEISENDIQELGHWPLSDLQIAILIESILGAGASAVGVDIYRDLPIPPGEQRLDRLLGPRAKCSHAAAVLAKLIFVIGTVKYLAHAPRVEAAALEMLGDRDCVLGRLPLPNPRRLKIQDVDTTLPIAEGAQAVTFTVSLLAGSTRLQTWFMDDRGNSRGAYYVEVEWLAEPRETVPAPSAGLIQ